MQDIAVSLILVVSCKVFRFLSLSLFVASFQHCWADLSPISFRTRKCIFSSFLFLTLKWTKKKRAFSEHKRLAHLAELDRPELSHPVFI